MKTNKIVIIVLILIVVAIGGYAWYTLSQPTPAETINYQTQQVEKSADPVASVTEEVAAVGTVEAQIDAQLDSLENKTF
jgi:predicted negative regulator of RcsB-dependent stress response